MRFNVKLNLDFLLVAVAAVQVIPLVGACRSPLEDYKVSLFVSQCRTGSMACGAASLSASAVHCQCDRRAPSPLAVPVVFWPAQPPGHCSVQTNAVNEGTHMSLRAEPAVNS